MPVNQTRAESRENADECRLSCLEAGPRCNDVPHVHIQVFLLSICLQMLRLNTHFTKALRE